MIEGKVYKKWGFERALVLRESGSRYSGRCYYTIQITRHEKIAQGLMSPETMLEDNSIELEVIKAIIKAGLDSDISNDSSIASELRATKYHLEDMKKIAFDQLGINNKGE